MHRKISTHNTAQSFIEKFQLANWLIVRLQTKWLRVLAQLQSLK